MFKCNLWLRIIAKDGEVYLSRVVDLPFCPFLGLAIDFDKDDAGFVVEAIRYSIDDGTFDLSQHCEFGHDCNCHPEDDCCVLATCAPITELTGSGWKLEDVLMGQNRLHPRKWQFEPYVI